MKLSFIGLGHMGAPMARNLIKAGHTLCVFDIVKANVEALTSLGASAAQSPKDCAAQGELVITMLPSSPHVKAVYLGSDGVMAGVKKGTTLVDCSTIDPHTAREVAKVTAIKGGLEIPSESGNDPILIANAAVIVSFDDGKTS